DSADGAAHDRSDAVKIRLESAGPDVVGVAVNSADDRRLAADFALFGHQSSFRTSKYSKPTGKSFSSNRVSTVYRRFAGAGLMSESNGCARRRTRKRTRRGARIV